VIHVLKDRDSIIGGATKAGFGGGFNSTIAIGKFSRRLGLRGLGLIKPQQAKDISRCSLVRMTALARK